MKNLIIILATLALTSTTTFATTLPGSNISVEALDIFTSTSFDADTENLTFNTVEDISVVQIFNNNGDMEFLLPVMSNNVQINKNLFEEGTYKLGFVLEGQTQVHFSEVVIK